MHNKIPKDPKAIDFQNESIFQGDVNNDINSDGTIKEKVLKGQISYNDLVNFTGNTSRHNNSSYLQIGGKNISNNSQIASLNSNNWSTNSLGLAVGASVITLGIVVVGVVVSVRKVRSYFSDVEVKAVDEIDDKCCSR